MLGPVVTPFLLILSPDDGEGVHDVGYRVAWGREAGLEPRQVFSRLAFRRAPVAILLGRQVEVEKGGVQLAAEQEVALLVPAERWSSPATILREGLQVPRCQ